MALSSSHFRYIVYGVLWLMSARYASKTEPAALQLLLVLTTFYLIFTNLGKRLPGESSAYTIYNNGEALPGQLRAEQFDDEVRHRDSRPFRSPDRPGEPLLAGDRHARVLAELRREALAMRGRIRARR